MGKFSLVLRWIFRCISRIHTGEQAAYRSLPAYIPAKFACLGRSGGEYASMWAMNAHTNRSKAVTPPEQEKNSSISLDHENFNRL